MRADRWLLPEGVEEALPPRAWRVEQARRGVLDLFRSWGYELVRPPFIEYLDSLLTGAGAALELETFTLVDQLSGRQMGLRADMTPQAARIDAHRIPREGSARYCYVGSVLRTRPDGLGGTRTPLQVGAELFGSAELGADVEIVRLMLALFERLGISGLHLDLGHVGIYRSLAARLGLDAERELQVFDILQRKSRPDMAEFLADSRLSGEPARALGALLDLNGGMEVLVRARALFGADAELQRGLDALAALADQVRQRYPALAVHVDLAELRGYRYKTGIVFAAYLPGQARELARGGRYDGVGAAFGRARAATGFSADLNALVRAMPATDSADQPGIYAPAAGDVALEQAIAALRAEGRSVKTGFGADTAKSLDCQQELVQSGANWVVRPVTQ